MGARYGGPYAMAAQATHRAGGPGEMDSNPAPGAEPSGRAPTAAAVTEPQPIGSVSWGSTDRGNYGEVYLYADGRFGLYAEDMEEGVTQRLNLAELEELHRCVGHLLWLAYRDERKD